MRKHFLRFCLCLLLVSVAISNAAAWRRVLLYTFDNGWHQGFSNCQVAEEVTYQESNFSIRSGPQIGKTISSGKGVSFTVTDQTFLGVAYYVATGAEVTFRVILTDSQGKAYAWENKPHESNRWYNFEDEAGERRVLVTQFTEKETGSALLPGTTIKKVTLEQEAPQEIEQAFYFDEFVVWEGTDTESPSQVLGLLAYRENGAISLKWDRASDNTGVVSYRIYRGNTPESLVLIGETNELQFRDQATETETNYYQVAAVDHCGNQGALSDPIVVWKDDNEPPPVPVALVATPFAWGNSTRLDWQGITLLEVDDLAGYRVYRQMEGELWATEVAFISGSVADSNYFFEEYALGNNILYTYKVASVDTSGNESEEAVITCIPKITDPVVLSYDFEEGDKNGWWGTYSTSLQGGGHNGSKLALMVGAYKSTDYNLQFFNRINFGINPETQIAFAYKVNSDLPLEYLRVVLESTSGKKYVNSFFGEQGKWVPVQFGVTDFATEAGGKIPLGTRIQKIELWARRGDGLGNQEFLIDNFYIYNGEDRQPPSLVSQPVATESGTDIVVSWEIPEDNINIAGFNIYRGIDQVSPQPSYKVNRTLYCDSNSYIDLGAAGTPYLYLIEAVDFSGNTSCSAASEPAEGVDKTPPGAPLAYGKSDVRGKVELFWDEPAPASDGQLPAYYRIYASSSLVDLKQSDNIVANYLAATKWSGTSGMSPGQEYYFLVTSVDATGNENFEGLPIKVKVATDSGPASATNLIPNPSAEEGMDAPSGWSQGTNEGNPLHIWDLAAACEGDKSFRIDGSKSDRGSWSMLIENLTPGKFYKFSSYYKAKDLSHPNSGLVYRVIIDGESSSDHLAYTMYDNLSPTEYWQRMEKTFVAPTGSNKMDLELYFWLTDGKIWFDNTELVELPVLEGPRHDSSVGSRPTLFWEPVQIDNYLGPISYNLQYSQDPNFQDATTVTVENILSAEYTIGNSLKAGLWYWRVSINTDPSQYPPDSGPYLSPSPYSQARSFEVGTGPVAPGNIQISTEPKGVLTISWQEVEAAHSYRIYRGLESGFLLDSAATAAEFVAGTTFTDFNVEPGREYFYCICSLAENETEGTPSEEVSAIALEDNVPPEGVCSFKVDGNVLGEILLSWSVPGKALDGDLPVAYAIYRRWDEDAEFSKIAETGELAFVDTTVASGENYEYYLIALDKVGNQSSPSETLQVIAPSFELEIYHEPIAMAGMGKDTTFKIEINNKVPDEVLFCYRYDGQTKYFAIPMKNVGDSWQLVITMPQVDTLSYYFEIKSGEDSFIYPQKGAEGPFVVKPLTGHPSGSLQIMELRVEPAVYNPQTNVLSIAYLLGQDANCSVKIYSVSGQLIRTLPTASGGEGSKAGVNILTWDGRDEQGRLVRNGPYIISVSAKAERAEAKAQKLVLVFKQKGGAER